MGSCLDVRLNLKIVMKDLNMIMIKKLKEIAEDRANELEAEGMSILVRTPYDDPWLDG